MDSRRRALIDFWPLLPLIPLLFIQPDALISFSSRWSAWLQVRPFTVFLIVAVVALGKMRWSYFFWGWVRDLVADTEKFQRLALLAKQAARLVYAEGLVERALTELKLRHDQAHVHGKKVLRTAQLGGNLFLFGAGAHPMWGVRGPLVLVIGVAQWEKGIRALMLGNLVRVAYLMGGVELLRTILR